MTDFDPMPFIGCCPDCGDFLRDVQHIERRIRVEFHAELVVPCGKCGQLADMLKSIEDKVSSRFQQYLENVHCGELMFGRDNIPAWWRQRC
jgi:hypothetical protein